MPRRLTPGRVLAAILVVAGALRAWGLWFGLPYPQARPDETVAFGTAVGLLTGDLNPHFFHWPTLHMYLLAALFGAAGVVGRMAGATGDLSFTQHALVGRAFVACAGTATIYMTFLLARRVAGSHAALVAAAFLAVAVLHVRDSHFALPDIVMTLLATWSLALVLQFVDENPGDGGTAWRLSSAAAAGAVSGLAASTRYNGGAVLAAMAAAQVWTMVRSGRRPWHIESWVPLCVSAVLFAVGFVAGTPYALLDPVKFTTDLVFDFTHLSQGHGVSVGPAWLRHAMFSLPLGAGLPVCLAALPGAVVLVRYYPKAAVVLGSFVAFFSLAIGRGRTAFARYALPLLPVLCVCAGVFVDAAARWLAPRLRRRATPVLAVLTIAMAAPSLVNSARLDALLGRADTRVLAARWFSEHVPPGSTMYETGSEYVRMNFADLRIHRWRFGPETGGFVGTEQLPEWLIVHTSPVAEYTPVPPRITALAATDYRLVRRFDATLPGASADAYDVQDAFFLPLDRFADVLRPGPTIAIYQRQTRVR